MNKTNQFSAKVQYVTPSCKSVKLQSFGAILSASNPYDAGRASNHWLDGYDGYNDYDGDDDLL